MNKLNLLKNALVLSAATLAVMPVSTVFAIDAGTNSTEREVSYNIVENGKYTTNTWVWSVPANTDLKLSENVQSSGGTVSIKPAPSDTTTNKVLVLEDNTVITISVQSGNFSDGTFYLQHGNSKMAYKIKIGANKQAISNGDSVLEFKAGTSANTGIESPMFVEIEEDASKTATLLGEHKDTLTFTTSVRQVVQN